MKYLICLILLLSCSHNLQKGYYRQVGKRQYLLQIDLSVPDAEKVFELSKDEICLRFHQSRAEVISREFTQARLMATIKCSAKVTPPALTPPKVQFLGKEKGVGKFFLKCGTNCR